MLRLSPREPIQLVLLGRIGDAIVSTAFLRAVRARYPDAPLRLLMSPQCRGLAPLLDIPGLELGFGARGALMLAKPAQVLIDLNPSASKTATAVIAAARARRKLGFRKKKLNFPYSDQIDAAGVDEPMLGLYGRLAAALDAPYDGKTALKRSAPPLRGGLVLHPGNFKKFDNRWQEEKFVKLADRLQEEGLRLTYLAGPGERAEVEAIARASKKPVPLLPPGSLTSAACALEGADAFLCNITGTTHLAHALGVPTFGLYSRYTDAVWRPREDCCGGVVSSEWESCRSIGVDEAHAGLRQFLARLAKR